MEEGSSQNQAGFNPTPQQTNPSPPMPGTEVPAVGVSQTPQTSVMGSVNPNKGGRGKKFIWVILGLVLLLILATAAYFLGSGKIPEIVSPKQETIQEVVPSNNDEFSEPASSEPQMVEGTEDWLTFKKEGQFSFKYPPEGEIKEYDDGSAAVTQWGPTQKEGTEFYDGLSLSFRAFDSEGKTLKETADEKYLELKEVFETTQPVVASVAGESGYAFHVQGFVRGDYYYVAINESLYLEIIDATKDPTNAGFTATSEKILMTVILGP